MDLSAGVRPILVVEKVDDRRRGVSVRPEAGVVLLAMGGPRRPEEVRPFLEALFRDPLLVRLPRLMRVFRSGLARRMAKRRAPRVGHQYAVIGHSPLVAATQELARRLEASSRAAGTDLRVWAGMRYGSSRTPDVLAAGLRALAGDAVGMPVVLLPQYPFYSGATTESSLRDAEAWLSRWGVEGIRIERYGSEPRFLALVERLVRASWAEVPEHLRPATHLLFSAHGLPASYVRRGDPYRDEVVASFGALAGRLSDVVPRDRVHLAFQSRVGPVPWLRPYTDDEIQRLAAGGVRSIVVVPFGFMCENLETLEEIDVRYRALAGSLGIDAFVRVPTPGLDPDHVSLLFALVEKALGDRSRDRVPAAPYYK